MAVRKDGGVWDGGVVFMKGERYRKCTEELMGFFPPVV